MDRLDAISRLPGPILIIGASGFIGANLLRRCLEFRQDVYGTYYRGNPWRLAGIEEQRLPFLDIQDTASLIALAERVKPATVFDCSSFGAYSFEQDFERIHSTNYLSFIRVMDHFAASGIDAYIHAGSSSEYGLNASAPRETDVLIPNSHYAVSKAAASHAISYYGKLRGVPVVNLRLYSVYGPYEDSSRLIPAICREAIAGKLPTFARPAVSRDFVHIDDVVTAFVQAALHIGPGLTGESFNIGTGIKTPLSALADLAREIFAIDEAPQFSPGAGRAWDVDDWYANPEKAADMFAWRAQVDLADGLARSYDWWKSQLTHEAVSAMTKAATP